MDQEELLRIDPALKVAMAIGHQAGLSKDLLSEWYGELILDEMDLEDFLHRIERGIHDQGLQLQLRSVIDSIPLVGKTTPSVVERTTVSQ